MAVIPIAWNINIVNSGKNRELYDYPAWKEIGTVFGTNYVLKLILRNSQKRKADGQSHQVICVQLERFLELNSSNVHGSISIHESATFKRFALKAFQHSFKDNEKVFSFNMIYFRNDYNDLFSSINLHGHISIDLACDLKPYQEYIASCPVAEVHKSFCHLSSDFRNLLQDNTFSDITFVCGDVKLFAHKNILSIRSPVFKAMLQKHTVEYRSGEIVIPDIKPAALKAMLDYIYCAETEDISEEVACNLLYAADKYELLELKERCVSYLKDKISNKNVFRILEVAILHEESLKLSCYNHIGVNFAALEKTKEWISLKKKNPVLIMEVLTSIVKSGK